MKSVFFYSIITLIFLSLSYFINKQKLLPISKISPQPVFYSVSSFDPKTSQAENELFQNLSSDQINSLNFYPSYLFIPTSVDSNKLHLSTGDNYTSPFGRQELNQNIREICAFNQKLNNYQWLNFVYLVNQNCNPDNADICWQSQSEEANYSTPDLIDCFTSQAGNLIKQSLSNQVKQELDSKLIISQIYDQVKRQTTQTK